MSLINKMLSDLEQRHSHRKEHDEIVIGGLAPVANTGFAQPRVPYNFLLICFFIIAVMTAGYGYWNNLSGRAESAVTLPVAGPEPDSKSPEAAVPEYAPAALKLDLSLPVVVPARNEQAIVEEPAILVEPEPVKMPELIPAVDTTITADESGYGHMEIKPVAQGDVRSPGRLLTEARAAYTERDYGKGDGIMTALLQQDPLYAEARSLYATSMAGRGEAGTAIQILASGLELNPAVTEWAMLCARLLTGQDRLAEAAGVLAKSMPSIENNPDYYALYAALLQRLSRHEEAISHYRALLQRQPDNGVWWIGLAISQERLQRPGEALASYNRALQGQSLNNELRQFADKQIRRLGQ